jgi:PAS domain S-box-containing protein
MNEQGLSSEAHYRAIVELHPDLVCRFRADGTLTFANEAYCLFFGLRREDMVGKKYAPVVHPDDLERVQVLVASLSPANPVVLIENRVFRADGAVRWTQWTNRALYDDQGRVVEYQSAGRDITDLKQAREDAARLAAIVTSAESAIFSTTLDGMIVSWNRAAERVLGYTAVEAIGQLHRILIPPDRIEEGVEILDRIRRGETVQHLETERLTKDGRRIPVSLTVSPIRDASGLVTGISKIVRDITARKRAERELAERESRFRMMADHAPVLIWVADSENRATYFNKLWVDFTGMPLEEQLGDGWLALIHEDDRARAGAFCRSHFERRLPFTMEFRLRHRSGEYRWVQDAGQPLFLPDGTLNGYIGSCVDIHDRKLVESVREQAVRRESEARAAAEEASRLKDEFLAIVSHELRTPLNAILGWARMLRDGTIAREAFPKALETIERNARTQAQLVEDLLDVSRIVSGKLILQNERVELASVVRAAVDVVRPTVDNKQIDLRTDLDDRPTAIAGDPHRLQQAVWNLLTNAVKFTPAGGRIDVGLRHDGTTAIITVRDTGAGIPADALPIIFDRFRQADSRPARIHGGLGLGLAIVAHVAEAHGGSVRASSDGPGHGATFVLTLPVPVATATVALPPPVAATRPDLRGRRVLVVDDEADARELARLVLERCGATVQTVGSAEDAIIAMGIELPDVLVADIGMPGRDGYDLIRKVRSTAAYRHVPAVAVTAYAGARDHEATLQAGYTAFLGKPVEVDALCATVASLCGPALSERTTPASPAST